MADRIVVGVNGSAGSRLALAWAAGEASVRGATLEAVTAWQNPDDGENAAGAGGDGSLEAASRLDAAVADLGDQRPPVAVGKTVVQGDAVAVLCDRAADATMLVVGSRGRGGVAGALLGSVSQKCAHSGCCPVVIVPPPRRRRASRHPARGVVLAGVDRSAGSRQALEWALTEARLRSWPLDVVEVWEDPYAGDMSIELDMPHFRREHRDLVDKQHEELERFVAEAAGEAPAVDVRAVLVVGDPAGALCERSASAGMLVVGSRGRGGIGRILLGSVSSSCAHHARCPVVIVPDAAVRGRLAAERTGSVAAPG